jgi:large subunit ribosomal protein L30
MVKNMTKAATKTGKTILVTQTGSMFRKKPGMRETLIGLGLGKIRRTRELIDTPEVRGMIRKVKHLVEVEEKA